MPAPPREDPPADSDADEEEGDECEYLLGFVEPPRKRADLLRHRFPSKASRNKIKRIHMEGAPLMGEP